MLSNYSLDECYHKAAGRADMGLIALHDRLCEVELQGPMWEAVEEQVQELLPVGLGLVREVMSTQEQAVWDSFLAQQEAGAARVALKRKQPVLKGSPEVSIDEGEVEQEVVEEAEGSCEERPVTQMEDHGLSPTQSYHSPEAEVYTAFEEQAIEILKSKKKRFF